MLRERKLVHTIVTRKPSDQCKARWKGECHERREINGRAWEGERKGERLGWM